MADNLFLTPGKQEQPPEITTAEPTTQFLEVDNYLSEYYGKPGLQAAVQSNINVPSKDDTYSKDDVDWKISSSISEAILSYLNAEDPHSILPQVEEMIKEMVKNDGSTPFLSPLIGQDPISDSHLTTKRFVTKLLRDHINSEDPHDILPEVRNLLLNYVLLKDIYSKSQIYTKTEVDNKLDKLIKKDGTTPFTKPQIGKDPTLDSHLATKRYADAILSNHLVDIDPHGFISILNNRLAVFAKKKDIYDKTLTYSRVLIDSLIRKTVEDALSESINDYMSSINDKLENIKRQHYTKNDGSVPFLQPLKGQKAELDNELTTLELVKEIVDAKSVTWITSGPTESTVGLVEEGTIFKNEVSFLEVMDAIFYGKRIKLKVPENGVIGESAEVIVCISGSLANISYAELYQEDSLIRIIDVEEFLESACITIETDLISKDTDITLKVYYGNGSVYETTETIKLAYPIFVGTLPKWKLAHTVTYSYLKELSLEDPNNNTLFNESKNISSIEHSYNFYDKKLRHLLVAVPASYPDLQELDLVSQKFGIGAFEVIDMIPLLIPGADNDIVYKLYIYKLALVRLETTVNFKFKP